MIEYYGVEWTYDNLEGIGYDSFRMARPFNSWFYDLYCRNFETESFDFADPYGRKIKEQSFDDVVITDDYNTKPTKTSEEDMSISDTTSKSATKTSEEMLTLSEDENRGISNKKSESIRFNLRYNKRISKKDVDTISLSEVSHNSGIRNSVSEVINVRDSSSRKIKFAKIERFFVCDEDELRNGSVLYDFELFNESTPKYQSDFNNYADNYAPLGYSELQPLIPGEYEYQDAYVGLKFIIPPTNGRYGTIDGVLHVDVEDTVVKDSLEIDGITEYSFAKKYYTVPQIQLRIVYADEGCYADLIEVSKDGFKVGLKSIITGNYVKGLIDFLVEGY